MTAPHFGTLADITQIAQRRVALDRAQPGQVEPLQTRLPGHPFT
jgi:hypothetical protein